MTPTAAILAGGKSTRMGSDKASLMWRGETLLARTARVCIEAGLPTFVVGREIELDWALPDVRFILDSTPHQGPLVGLIAALGACGHGPVLALACDMPLLSAAALRWLASCAPEPGSADLGVAIRGCDGRIQPLFSLYTPSALPLMRRRLSEGRRSLMGVIDAGPFTIIDAPEWVDAVLRNVNTPEDLRELM